MFPEQELRERLARIAATFPEDTDAAFELARVPAGFTVQRGYEQPVDHPAVVGWQIEPLDDHAGDVAAGPSARLAYIAGDPAEPVGRWQRHCA